MERVILVQCKLNLSRREDFLRMLFEPSDLTPICSEAFSIWSLGIPNEDFGNAIICCKRNAKESSFLLLERKKVSNSENGCNSSHLDDIRSGQISPT